MWSLADELVDLDKLASNDIYAILTTFGVEAARKAIIDEMSAVFEAYGIGVDYRHLTIIADCMVRGPLHAHCFFRSSGDQACLLPAGSVETRADTIS